MVSVLQRSLMRFLLTLLVLATACDPAPGPEREEVRATIDRTNQLLERWYARGQIDSAAMFFATDVWQMPPNAPPIVGLDAYREWWWQAVQWGLWQFDFSVQDVIVTDSIAVERGKYTLTFEAGSEAPLASPDDRGNYVAVWRLEPDGEWRILWNARVSESPVGSARSRASHESGRLDSTRLYPTSG